MQKKNEEVNQVNIRFEVKPSGNNWDLGFGISGMAGEIYNETVDRNGQRFAMAIYTALNVKFFHFNVQGTAYNYTQALPDTATQDMKDFINIS